MKLLILIIVFTALGFSLFYWGFRTGVKALEKEIDKNLEELKKKESFDGSQDKDSTD